MWRKMDFFAAVLAAVICTDLVVMSKAQAVFTIDATLTDNTEVNVALNASIFTEFYSCLCNGQSRSCSIRLGDENSVSTVESCPGKTSTQKTTVHACTILPDIVCEKPGYLDEGNDCSQTSIASTFCGLVTLEWTGTQQVEAKKFGDSITQTPCDGSCTYISATSPVSPPRPVQTTQAPTPIPRITQSSSSTTKQDGVTDTIAKDDKENDDNNDIPIIIGAVVGGAVIVVTVVTIIIIILWRRKQKAPSSSVTKNNSSQGPNVPSPPLDLSAKRTYYNSIDIIGDDPSEAHIQAVRKSTVTYMNTIDAEEIGSSPGHDTSRYEEVVFPQ